MNNVKPMTNEEAVMQTFGCTEADLKRNYAPRIVHGKQELGMFPVDPLMYAMGILSDAQETLAHGNTEECRQFINRAKYVMAEVMQFNERGAMNMVRP